MRVRSTLFALILTASSLSGIVHHPVAAQEIDPARFTPLEPGNRWEYSVEQVKGSLGPGSFLRFEVEFADTLLEERRYAIFRMEGFDADLNPLYRHWCAFYIEAGRWPDVEPLGDDPDACRPAIPLPPIVYPSISLNDTVGVGDRMYIVEATAWYAESHSSTGGAGATIIRSFAADIGTYQHDSKIFGRQLPPVGQDHHWIATLTHAEVNGVTYGSEKIATALEQPPDVAEEVPHIATLYPNPFQHEIRFQVEGLQAGLGHAEVFDVMGRRVLATEVELGREPTTLRLKGGPSGVYLLRVTDVSGRRVGKLIIRIAV